MSIDPELAKYLPGARGAAVPQRPRDIDTWMDVEIQKDREAEVRDTIISAPTPDAAARTRRLSQDLGVPLHEVAGSEDQAEKALQARRIADLTGRYPAIGKWASADPRGAAAAADDAESLGVLGTAWDTIKKVPASLWAGVQSFGVMGAKINRGFLGDLGDLWQGWEDIAAPGQRSIQQDSDLRAARDVYWTAGVDRAEAQRDAARPEYTGPIQQGLLQGTENGPMTVLAALASAATGSPTTGAYMIGAVTGGGSYDDARQQGLSVGQSVAYAGQQGGIEAVTEFAPLGTLGDMIARFIPFGKGVAKELVQEWVGEQIATAGQDYVDWAMLPENKDKPFKDYWDARPAAFNATTLAVLGGTAVTTGTIGVTHKTVDTLARIGDARQARRERVALDRLAKGADASKLKQRDPEAFRALQRAHAEESGATSVFIPGEAIRAFNQSEAYDPAKDPFINTDAHEAALTGGDVVMPIEDFLTDVVGTPAWDAIKDDVRLSQGGMSGREAQTFEEAMADVVDRAAQDMARSERSDRAARTTREQLVERMAGQFGESYTAPVARQYAEIAVQRAQTRAARLGLELKPEDLDGLSVRQVLPEGVAQAVAADRLDLVINALRAGKPVDYGVGPSLLEFIQQRGGINDPGGDLASMGVPSRFLRDYDPRQAELTGGLSGNGDFGIDSTLRAAIEAGYFPDLANVANEQGPSTLDTQRLLDALAEEVAGRLHHAEVRTDPMRASAEDLRQMLEEAGYSPTNMTDEDIRDVVERLAMENATQGRAYHQAQDAIAQVVSAAHGPTNRNIQTDYAQVPEWMIAMAGEHGLDIGGMSHRIDESAVRHVLKNHGNAATEASRGQIAITDADFSLIPDIVDLPDHVIFGLKNRIGRDLIVSVKTLSDGSTLVLEEVRNKRRVLALNSMRKYPSAMNVTHIVATLDPNARGDQGTAIKVVEVPKEVKKFDQEARGRVVFDQGRAVIELFKGRDLSTPIHELGHVWLEELAADATLPEAPEQMRADWDRIKSWFSHAGHAVAEDGTIPVEAHELFARGIERYFMEGKAPTPALTRIFENVRQWMLRLYQSVHSLRSEITPEVREVFDRMLASDEEIAAAREQQGTAALFKQAAEAGMSKAEFAAYQAQAEDASAAAHAKLLNEVMSTIRRRETERYREARNDVRAEEQVRIDDSPIYRAIAAMDSKRGGTRVSKEWIVDRMGLDALDMLPRRVPPLFIEGGVHPDAIAEMSGYSSGMEMLESLIGAERTHRQAREQGDTRTMRERAIETATDAEMNRRYGDPLNDGSIEREALAAVQSDRLGDMIASEIRALGRKTGRGPLPYQVARDWARTKVRSGKWIDVASPGALVRHARNAARAAKAAEAALVAGDHAGAYQQKQFQMINNALAAEAYTAADEVEVARKRMAAVAEAKTRKGVDQGYLEQAQMLLESVDLRRRSQIYEKRKGSFAAWAAARAAEGHDMVVPETFESTLAKTNWSKMPVDDILMLDEAIKQIMHLGRLKQTLLDGQEEREWEAIEAEAVASAAQLTQRPPADLADPTLMENIGRGIAGWDASLLKMETVFDWLDGGDSNGVFNRIAFRPIADAQAREADMLKDYHARIKALFEAVPAETAARWQDRITLPFTDIETGRLMVLNRQKIISMALNVGNEGNLQRLADGYHLNRGALVGYLDETLTKEEWQFVQGVWDTVDTLWPEAEAMAKRVNGVAPDKVRPRKFDTSTNGQMRGGYYPAVYDTTRDYRAQENAGKESDLLDSRYSKATTNASSSKDRSEQVKRPILLDLGVINRHLGEVIHDITHREAVIRANRFLSSERVRRAVDAALGREIGNQFRPWVKFVANSWAVERAGNEGIGKWLGKLRANATAVGMGLRATTMISQVSGYSNSMEVVGEAAMAKALAQFARNPAAAVRDVMARSDEVRHRMGTLDRDLRTEIARMAQTHPASKAAAMVMDGRRFFFHGIGYMDMVVSVPTWMAGYANALQAGMSETDAAYAGDKAVRQSQGSGGAKDLASIQRGTGKWGAALQIMTMFYSMFSAQYQRQRTLARDMAGSDGRRPRNLPRLAARAFFLLVLPPLLTEVLRGVVGAPAGPDDDEWWTQWALRKLLANSLGPIPIVRDVFEPVWNKARGAGYANASFTPLQRAYDSVVNLGGDVGKIARGDETKHATKDTLETVGYLTGLVPGQIASATQFLVDLGNGDVHPDGPGQFIEGLTTGKIEKDD